MGLEAVAIQNLGVEADAGCANESQPDCYPTRPAANLGCLLQNKDQRGHPRWEELCEGRAEKIIFEY